MCSSPPRFDQTGVKHQARLEMGPAVISEAVVHNRRQITITSVVGNPAVLMNLDQTDGR